MKTYTNLNKRPDVAEFDEIYDFLASIRHELTAWWPVPPKENLEAQKSFLEAILDCADKNPKKSKAECILQIKDTLKSEELNKVLFAPPNITGLRWDFFAARDDRMTKLIEQAKEQVRPTEAQQLLSSSTLKSSYGSI